MSVILDAIDLEREYSPSRWSTRFPTALEVLQNHVKHVTAASEEATNNIPHKLEIEYGSTPGQKLDILGTDLPNEYYVYQLLVRNKSPAGMKWGAVPEDLPVVHPGYSRARKTALYPVANLHYENLLNPIEAPVLYGQRYADHALDSSSKSHTRGPKLEGVGLGVRLLISVCRERELSATDKGGFQAPQDGGGSGIVLVLQRAGGPGPPPLKSPRPRGVEAGEGQEVVDAEGLKGERGSETLRQAVREGLRQIAGKKSQPAGAAQLKSVEAEIMAAAFDICRVPSAGKVHRDLADMRRELTRLSASNAALEAELRATKAELAVCRGRQPQPPAEPDLVELLRREMAAFQQRFNVLESKLLRPPLAASSSATSRSYAAVAARPSTSSGQTSRGAQPVARPRAAPPTRTPAPPVVQAPAGGQAVNASTGRRRGRRGAAAQQAAPVTSEPTLPASGDWQVVGEARRVAKEARKRRKKAQRQRRQQQRKEKRAAALLLAPKTAAVVITLQPDAVQKGVTYGDVLDKLKGAVTPAEFGAPDGFSMKVTATGARLLEVPGAASGSSADALAERIRACLGAEEARVSRPIKCLDLRIMGLDDSVTEHEVVAAVARTGGCPVDQ
ncbi:hypothetical protein SFRURICE_004650, partial [Spodoptera frugiperda]